MFDLTIVGGGPAGCQAAIYAASEGMKVRLIEKGKIGGQIVQSPMIENFVGFENGVSGTVLNAVLKRQLKKFKVTIARKQISNLYDVCDSHHIILAIGMKWTEDYKRWCKPEDCINKPVYGNIAVIGGSNSAAQTALELSKTAKTVDLVIRGNIKMSQYLVQRLRNKSNVFWRKGYVKNFKVVIEDNYDRDCDYDQIFFCGGLQPNTKWLKDLIQLNEDGYIKVNQNLSVIPFNNDLKHLNVFAIGDAREGSVKRLSAALGDSGRVINEIWRIKNDESKKLP